MVWILVTAVPNDEHLDSVRAQLLIDSDEIVAFGRRPDEHLTQVWTNWDPDTSTLQVAETLEVIRQLIAVEERRLEYQRQIARVRAELKVQSEQAAKKLEEAMQR
jgi:hypothetical protein